MVMKIAFEPKPFVGENDKGLTLERLAVSSFLLFAPPINNHLLPEEKFIIIQHTESKRKKYQ